MKQNIRKDQVNFSNIYFFSDMLEVEKKQMSSKTSEKINFIFR